MRHYHLLSGTTESNKPSHKFMFQDLDIGVTKFNTLHRRYLELNPGCTCHTAQPVQDIQNDLTATPDRTNTAIYGAAVGQAFKEEYMIAFYSCDDPRCLNEFN